MEFNLKRLLSFAVALVMVLSMVPLDGLQVFAAGETQTNQRPTSTDPAIDKIMADAATIQEKAETAFDDKYCPVCGKDVTWVALGTAAVGLETGDHHYYLTGKNYGSLTKGTSSATYNVFDLAKEKTTLCLLLTGAATIAGRINITGASSVLNVMSDGDGALHGTGLTGTNGLLQVTGANSKINIYGGTITRNNAPAYTSGSSALRAILYVGVDTAECNVFDGAVIGPQTRNDAEMLLNTYIGGKFNMYGGTIRNGNTTYEAYIQDLSKEEETWNASVARSGNIWVYTSKGTFNMYAGEVTGGRAKRGGNVYAVGKANIYGGKITNGVATADGGNIYFGNTSTISGGEITGGSAPSCGGNIAVSRYGYASSTATTGIAYAYGKLTVSGGTISGGKGATYGGNIYVRSSCTFTMNNGTVKDGTSTSCGGNIHLSASGTINGGTITGGTSVSGGSIYAAGTVKIASTVSGGSGKNGGNIHVASGTTTIDGAVSGGTASNAGGNIYIAGGTVTINKAVTGGTTTHGVEATTPGGGNIYITGGTTTVKNSVTGGSADDGGNIKVVGGANLILDGATVSGGVPSADAAYGSNIRIDRGTLTLKNKTYVNGPVNDKAGKPSFDGGILLAYGSATDKTTWANLVIDPSFSGEVIYYRAGVTYKCEEPFDYTTCSGAFTGSLKVNSGSQAASNLVAKYVDGQVLIPHVNGEAKVEDKVDATCKTPGSYNTVVRCVVCDAVQSSVPGVLEIDPNKHENLKTETAKAPDCTNIGWAEYEHCDACGYSTYEEMKETGHSYEHVTTPPTCTEDGYITSTCSACGDTYTTAGETATGHDHSIFVETVNATETEGGYDIYKCACGDVIHKNPTDPLGEEFTVKFVVPYGVEYAASEKIYDNYPEVLTAPEYEGYTFEGWSVAPVSKTETKPAMVELDAEGKYDADADITLYAVFSSSVTHPGTAGSFAAATEIAVGDTVYLVCDSKKMQLSGFTTSGTIYGKGIAYTSTPNANTYPLTVAAGSASGTYAFKTPDGKYLYWTSSNSLNVNATLNANTSWKVSFDGGNAIILNGKDNTRKLQWNAASPRFACYTSAQTAVQLYKQTPGTADTVITEYFTADEYTVTFHTPEGVTAPEAVTVVTGQPIDLSEITVSAPEGATATFAGWVVGEVEKDDKVTLYTGSFVPTADITLNAAYSFVAKSEPVTEYVAANASDLQDGAVVVITNKNSAGTYAMSNDNGTSKAPAAVSVTVANNKLSGTVATNLKWTVDKNGSNMTFYKYGDTKNALYATNTNNGLRVGTNTNNVFVIKDAYLFNDGTSRYIGIYNSQDWRCYETINSNIENQTLEFYVETLSEAVDTTYYTTNPSTDPCYNGHTEGDPVVEAGEAADCGNDGYHYEVVYCSLCEDEISRTKVVDLATGEHDYESVVTPPTFDAEGFTTHTCSVCGDSYTDSKVPAKIAVAEIGEEKFASLQDAIAAAGENATVVLLKNTEVADSVIIDKNVTIDLNGKTVSAAATLSSKPVIRVLGNVTVTNGTVDGTTGINSYAFIVGNNATAGTLNIADGTYKGITSAISVTQGVAYISGGTYSTAHDGEGTDYGAYYLLNLMDNSASSIVVTGGTFVGFNPEDNKAENPAVDFTADGYIAVKDADGNYTVREGKWTAKVGTQKFETLADAIAAGENDTVTLMADVELTAFVTIDKSVTIDLGEYDIIRADGTALYVNGDVEVTIKGTTGTVTGDQALYVSKGLVKIYNGAFRGVNADSVAVYVINTGKVEIYGGTFSVNGESNFVLNEYDSTRETSSITVYGGTFMGFNPEDNKAENPAVDFTADGYIAVKDADGNYTVREGKWIAKVGTQKFETLADAIAAAQTNDTIALLADVEWSGYLNGATLNLNGKTIKGNVAGTVAINGGTYITPEDYKMAGPEADYYKTSDAVLTITVNGDITIEAGTMELAQSWWTTAGQTLTVAAGATFVVPADMTLNVNGSTVIVEGTLTVNGEVNLYSASATIKAVEGLNVITTVADHKVAYMDGVYCVIDADINAWNETTKVEYKTVEEALAAAKSGETVKLLADSEANAFFVWGGITLDLNGYKLTANGIAASFTGANIIDSSAAGTGLLVVPENAFSYHYTNSHLVIKTPEGYRFADAQMMQKLAKDDNGYIFYVGLSRESDMLIAELIKKHGAADLHLQFRTLISWDTERGSTTQDFRFRDALVEDYAGQCCDANAYSKAMWMSIYNVEGLEKLSFTAEIAIVDANGKVIQSFDGETVYAESIS